MLEVKEKAKVSRKLNSDLKSNYATALKDPKFKAIIGNLKVKEDVAIKYTSKLEDTVCELKNCEKCSSLLECKNKVEGYVNFPKVKDNKLVFSYVACKYKKKQIDKEKKTIDNNEFNNASFKDIDIEDKKRHQAIKWLKDFYKNYDIGKKMKGLYLHGSFGCGKSYLIAATLNELQKKRVKTAIVYYPELIRELKGDFDTYADKMEYYQNVDILLLDDIGAEKVTEWSRDEVLGTILQHRMNNHLPTFFTSNLNINELESHLCTGSGSDSAIKARRIIQRIIQLSDDIELISENRRK